MTLPKFLLAWADINWLWIQSRLRPAKAADWTLARTLSLTLLAAATWAVFGLALAQFFYGHAVGWLPWLLGLWRGCLGLCWYGVTGLCWNQRARQLRANPEMPTGLARSRFRVGRWGLGLVYLLVLGVVTPLALVLTVENVRGEIVWRRTRARLVAAGEKLTFREILGPAIPPEQNAGAAPVFAPFFDYYQDTTAKLIPDDNGLMPDDNGQYPSRIVWRQSNALERLRRTFESPGNYLPKPTNRSNARTPALNLDDWSAAFRTAVAKPNRDDPRAPWDLALPAPGNAARDVLAGLEPAEPLLAEVCAAAALPRSQFTVHYEEAFDALLAHVAWLKEVQLMLELRCAAHLALGETDRAFADATNALNVAELLREEPFLISQLVRYAQGSLALRSLWQGLAEHRWNDAQLAAFANRLARVDYMPGIVLAFEGERAGGIQTMENLIANPSVLENLTDNPPAFHWPRFFQIAVLRQNQAAAAELQSAMIADSRAHMAGVSKAGLSALLEPSASRVERFAASGYSPYTAMAAMLAPAIEKASSKTARVQTAVKLALAAIALERYRLAHGEFPEKLEQLVPQFLAAVPPDPMTNQPFHYKRTDDGWFLLYSVGPDGKDDGGVMRSGNPKDKEDKDWPWPVPTRPEAVLLF
jgi:hypothetical protein